MWEALAGARLFDAGSAAAALRQIRRGGMKPPSAHRPEVPRRARQDLHARAGRRPRRALSDRQRDAGRARVAARRHQLPAHVRRRGRLHGRRVRRRATTPTTSRSSAPARRCRSATSNASLHRSCARRRRQRAPTRSCACRTSCPGRPWRWAASTSRCRRRPMRRPGRWCRRPSRFRASARRRGGGRARRWRPPRGRRRCRRLDRPGHVGAARRRVRRRRSLDRRARWTRGAACRPTRRRSRGRCRRARRRPAAARRRRRRRRASAACSEAPRRASRGRPSRAHRASRVRRRGRAARGVPVASTRSRTRGPIADSKASGRSLPLPAPPKVAFGTHSEVVLGRRRAGGGRRRLHRRRSGQVAPLVRLGIHLRDRCPQEGDVEGGRRRRHQADPDRPPLAPDLDRGPGRRGRDRPCLGAGLHGAGRRRAPPGRPGGDPLAGGAGLAPAVRHGARSAGGDRSRAAGVGQGHRARPVRPAEARRGCSAARRAESGPGIGPRSGHAARACIAAIVVSVIDAVDAAGAVAIDATCIAVIDAGADPAGVSRAGHRSAARSFSAAGRRRPGRDGRAGRGGRRQGRPARRARPPHAPTAGAQADPAGAGGRTRTISTATAPASISTASSTRRAASSRPPSTAPRVSRRLIAVSVWCTSAWVRKGAPFARGRPISGSLRGPPTPSWSALASNA